jgi:hypothetical protein
MIRAAVELVPGRVRDVLGLDARWGLGVLERPLVRLFGRIADRVVIPSSPPAQARRRLGLA